MAVRNAQTSLDPEQLRAWIPGLGYGGHAFGFIAAPTGEDDAFARFHAARAKILRELAFPGAPATAHTTLADGIIGLLQSEKWRRGLKRTRLNETGHEMSEMAHASARLMAYTLVIDSLGIGAPPSSRCVSWSMSQSQPLSRM